MPFESELLRTRCATSVSTRTILRASMTRNISIDFKAHFNQTCWMRTPDQVPSDNMDRPMPGVQQRDPCIIMPGAYQLPPNPCHGNHGTRHESTTPSIDVFRHLSVLNTTAPDIPLLSSAWAYTASLLDITHLAHSLQSSHLDPAWSLDEVLENVQTEPTPSSHGHQGGGEYRLTKKYQP